MTEDYDVDATMRLMQAELAAMKARAEAAEKRVKDQQELKVRYFNERDEWKARAEAAEKERDLFAKLYAEEGHAKMILMEESSEFRAALDKGPAASVEAQAEINHWREHAEAAEKRVKELEQEIDDMYAALEAKP